MMCSSQTTSWTRVTRMVETIMTEMNATPDMGQANSGLAQESIDDKWTSIALPKCVVVRCSLRLPDVDLK